MGIRAGIADRLAHFFHAGETCLWAPLTWPPPEWNPASARALVHWEKGQATVTVRGELDHASAPELDELLTTEVRVRRPRRVVLDLRGVTFIDCAGLRPVARAQRLLSPECPLVLRSPSAAVRRLLTITGMDRAYPIDGAAVE